MDIYALIEQLKGRRVTLALDGDKIRYEAPPGAAVTELVELLRTHKKSLVPHLKRTELFRNHPVQRRRAVGDCATAPAQQQLWMLDEISPHGRRAPAAELIVRIDGELDRDRLQAALDGVRERHESLRTTLVERADGLVQRIDNGGASMPLAMVDCDAHTAAGAEISVEDVRAQCAVLGMAAEDGTARAVLLRFAPDRHMLHLSVSPLHADDWSLRIVFEELTRGYAVREGQGGEGFAGKGLQAADHAAWQRRLMMLPELREAVKARVQVLARHRPSEVLVPTDIRTPVGTATARPQSLAFVLPAGASEILRQIASRKSTSLLVPVLAGWALVMHESANVVALVVGTEMPVRDSETLRRVVGRLSNLVPVAIAVNPDRTLAEHLDGVEHAFREAELAQDLPFACIVEDLKLSPTPGNHPVFTTSVQVGHVRPPAVDAAEAMFSVIRSTADASHSDVSIMVDEADGAMKVSLISRAGDLSAGALGHLAVRLQHWLERIAFDPMTTITKTLTYATWARPDSSDQVLPETASDSAFALPETVTLVAKVWGDVVRMRSVPIDVPFTVLGATSIHALRVCDALKQHFGSKVTLRDIYQAPSVVSLASLIERRGIRTGSAAETIRLEDLTPTPMSW